MPKLGLIAGSGRFPLLFAEQARRMGAEVLAMGIEGVTDKRLEELVGPFQTFKLGQIDKPIQAFKAAGVTQAVMAGKVQHASLFGGILPDWRAVKMLARLRDKKTDTILKAVAAEFAKDGIELISSVTYLSHLMAGEGALTKRAPTPEERSDIDLGWEAAKAIAGLDIGQSAVVQDGAVVALEAMEGTDACIRRAAELAKTHGKKPALVVVKVAKPKQDLRFDLPVIGLDSLQVFSQAQVTALALEAGSTLIFDKDDFLKGAEAQGLAVLGVKR